MSPSKRSETSPSLASTDPSPSQTSGRAATDICSCSITQTPSTPRAGAIWNTSPSVVFTQAPKDTHWYFLSYSSGAQAKQDVEAQRNKWLDALSKRPEEEQAHWKPRLHFVPVSAWQLPGWIGATLKKKGVFHFGIDPMQRRREIGMARMPMGNQPGHLRHLVFETQWYAWELKQHHLIETLEGKKTVTIFDKVPVQSGWGGKKKFTDVDMPSAAGEV